VSEPLMRCRYVYNRRRNRDLHFYPASKGWERPAYCPTGVRHEGGVTLRRASIRNTGTCRSDVKGEIQAGITARIRVPMRSTGAEMPVVGKKVL
jgi:hypothetical protein